MALYSRATFRQALNCAEGEQEQKSGDCLIILDLGTRSQASLKPH